MFYIILNILNNANLLYAFNIFNINQLASYLIIILPIHMILYAIFIKYKNSNNFIDGLFVNGRKIFIALLLYHYFFDIGSSYSDFGVYSSIGLFTIINILTSFILFVLIPNIFKTITLIASNAYSAQKALLFMTYDNIENMNNDKKFQNILDEEITKGITQLKLICATGANTFVNENSFLYNLFQSEKLKDINDIEIMICHPEKNGIMSRSAQTPKFDLDELKEQIYQTLEFLNVSEFANNIKLKFYSEEPKYKIIVINDLVIVQGYLATRDSSDEYIYGFRNGDKSSLFKIFITLFDDKFRWATNNISNIASEYKNIQQISNDIHKDCKIPEACSEVDCIIKNHCSLFGIRN